MIDKVFAFLVGLFLGGFIGVLMVALCVMAGRNEGR